MLNLVKIGLVTVITGIVGTVLVAGFVMFGPKGVDAFGTQMVAVGATLFIVFPLVGLGSLAILVGLIGELIYRIKKPLRASPDASQIQKTPTYQEKQNRRVGGLYVAVIVAAVLSAAVQSVPWLTDLSSSESAMVSIVKMSIISPLMSILILAQPILIIVVAVCMLAFKSPRLRILGLVALLVCALSVLCVI